MEESHAIRVLVCSFSRSVIFLCLAVCLTVCLSVYLSTKQFFIFKPPVYLSVSLLVFNCLSLSRSASFQMRLRISIRGYIRPSVCLSVCPSCLLSRCVCLSACIFKCCRGVSAVIPISLIQLQLASARARARSVRLTLMDGYWDVVVDTWDVVVVIVVVVVDTWDAEPFTDWSTT